MIEELYKHQHGGENFKFSLQMIRFTISSILSLISIYNAKTTTSLIVFIFTAYLSLILCYRQFWRYCFSANLNPFNYFFTIKLKTTVPKNEFSYYDDYFCLSFQEKDVRIIISLMYEDKCRKLMCSVRMSTPIL